MVTQGMQRLLEEILRETERHDKISVHADPVSRTVTITPDEWRAAYGIHRDAMIEATKRNRRRAAQESVEAVASGGRALLADTVRIVSHLTHPPATRKPT